MVFKKNPGYLNALLPAKNQVRAASSKSVPKEILKQMGRQRTPSVAILTIVLSLILVACASTAEQLSSMGTVQAVQATQIGRLAEVQAQQATHIARQSEFISYLATRGPAPVMVPASQLTPTPFRPVQASLLIENDRCCVGGTAGDTIDVRVDFRAFSPLAEVTEMRVIVGGIAFEESDLEAAQWVSFADSQTFPIQVALNWTGFHVSAQFRDAAGNLSQVAHDDISVEGNPPTPTS